jgi:hypothetical protein
VSSIFEFGRAVSYSLTNYLPRYLGRVSFYVCTLYCGFLCGSNPGTPRQGGSVGSLITVCLAGVSKKRSSLGGQLKWGAKEPRATMGENGGGVGVRRTITLERCSRGGDISRLVNGTRCQDRA